MEKINGEEINSIFKEIKKDNVNGLEELYKIYHKKVYGIAFSIVKNRDDAEDIMQIVFTKIQQMEKSKLPSDKAMTWMYTLTKNETFNFLKKKRKNISLDNMHEIENKNDEIKKIEDIIQFNKLIHKLNPKEQEIVSLKILSDFSFQEISELLNEPIGTIKWRYYKSLKSIKGFLGSLAMFVITFIIGMKTILIDTKKYKEKQEMIQTEDTIDENKEEIQNTIQQEDDNMNNEEVQDTDQNKEIQDIIQEENTTKGESGNRTEQNSTTNIVEETNNETSTNTILPEDEIKQETIVDQEIHENQILYTGIGMICISIIFFIISIIFFIKYQLKRKKKLSK